MNIDTLFLSSRVPPKKSPNNTGLDALYEVAYNQWGAHLELVRYLKNYVTPDGRDVFDDWLLNLRDRKARAIIRTRLDRIQYQGNFGFHRSVSHGVFELKIDFGPGYRVYYAEEGNAIVVLLGGGDKDAQHKDIRKAHERWAEYRSRP